MQKGYVLDVILPNRIGQQNGIKRSAVEGQRVNTILVRTEGQPYSRGPGISGTEEVVDDTARGSKPRQRLQRYSDIQPATPNGATPSEKELGSCKASFFLERNIPLQTYD